jgi:hypothetical protein
MSDNGNFGFAKLVPGFDFLQSLAKGASQGMPQMPGLSSWVAPTLNVEELDKRINELKAVHFWLDQNGKALGATIQALEVQKMTLATLQGMNFKMADVADALKARSPAPAPAPATANATKAKSAPHDEGEGKAAPRATQAAATAAVDPLQWWGALTQQFQEIATNAMKDNGQQNAMDSAREAMKAATGMATGMAEAVTSIAKPPAAAKKKPAARKSAPRKSTPRKGRTRT